MKKILALLLAFLVALSLLTACGAEEPLETEIQEAGLGFTFDPGAFTIPEGLVSIRETQPEVTDPPQTGGADGTKVANGRKLTSKNGDLRYVLVYNPTVYDEGAYDGKNVRYSPGTLGTQIDVGMTRSDGLAEDRLYWPIGQDQLPGIPAEEVDLSGSKAAGLGKTYRVGDTQNFYGHTAGDTSEPRQLYTFQCRYAGTNCYIWTYDTSLDDAAVKAIGREFDNTVYGAVTKAFGKPRYEKDKVHLMIYPIQQYVLGLFNSVDLYTSSELTSAQIKKYGANTDVNMVHINALWAERPEYRTVIYATLAHEYQHLICFSDALARADAKSCNVWLNEAMSGYIEELLYPGTKEADGHLKAYEESYLIRWGWSLYDFSTNSDDIGAYGSVYLFSEYLANLAGKDVFSEVHDYWRTGYGTEISDAKALRNAVPGYVERRIDQSITYPAGIKFRNEDEEWLSKLTLDFYLSLLRADSAGPAAFRKIDRQALLYDGVFASEIAGGGRLILALSGDTFTVPSDADKGLIYVGLNEDFEVVTDFIY